MEIERKWKISGFPAHAAPIFTAAMQQSYLSTSPVVRVRESIGTNGHSFILCFKGQGTLAREEIELPLQESVYRALVQLTGCPPISKELRAYRLPCGALLEVSLVDAGLPTEFYYAEVEFDSIEQAHAFTPPSGFGLLEEMTEDEGFSMSRYWQQTRGSLTRCPYCGCPLHTQPLSTECLPALAPLLAAPTVQACHCCGCGRLLLVPLPCSDTQPVGE